MSTTARTTPRGGKNNKAEVTSTPKPQKSDTNKSESPKIGLDKSQVPTAEQMRMAEIMDTTKNDLALKDKIKQVMDATQKSEDEVCTALHDCDNDANKAVNYLLEGSVKNEWSTSVVKKKKNRTASAAKGAEAVNNHTETEDWGEPTGPETTSGGGRGRDRARQRGSGPPRLRGRGSTESRGWRGREDKENQRNLEDNFNGERGRRGDRGGRMSNGPGRGGRGGRGGGRLGSRTFQRGERPSGGGFPRSIDTWNNPSADDGSGEKMENWDANGAEDWDAEEYKNKPNENWDGFPSPEDWDNEEYTGSLADSKVFTPSSGPEPPAAPGAQAPAADGDKADDGAEQPTQPPAPDTQPPPPRPVQMPPSPVGVNTLTPAQSQYLSQLTQQSSDYKAMAQSAQPPPQQYPATYPAPSAAYSSSYGVSSNSYSSSLQDGTTAPSAQPLPARTKPQKPRVPPPSKIPSSAVEMPPGDAITVALLDVQFGGLEFGSDSSSLETSTSLDERTTGTTTTVASATPASAPNAPAPTSVAASVASIMESYAAASQQTQPTSLASALAQTQKLAGGDSMLPDVVVTQANSYAATRPVNTAASSVLTELTNSAAKSSAVDTTLAYNSTDSTLYQSQTYQKPSAAAGYPAPTPVSTYNSSSYSTSQVTSSSTGYSSQTGSGYTNSYGGGGGGVTQSTASYPSYTSNQTSYAYTSYPSNSYQSSGQMYQGSGSTTGYPTSYQNSSYPPSAAAQQNHKINAALGTSQAKDSQYESGQVNSNSVPAVSTVSSTPSLGLSATSQTAASTKVTALSTANKSGIVAGIPPQVPPMINTHQYIMGQAGLPYFQQPMFSYDELMLQQRIAAAPPMPTGYFDMSFQQQGGAGTAGRDASLGNVAYSMSDGRFARADNASPVPSTLSQNVTTGHQQPMLNPAGLPPGYTYIYGGFPTNYQFTTPTALYPMAPTAAAGNSTSGQYKGPGYGSAAGYGSGYEAGADGYKVGGAGGYSATPQTKAGGGTPTTSADLYTKGHATLNKVNSYDKAGFHSGTPPPFNLTGSQTGLAPSGTYTPHLFISTLPPHQQHHSGATLMHQPLHQDGAASSGPRTQTTSQPNKAGSKQQNYSPSFWATSS